MNQKQRYYQGAHTAIRDAVRHGKISKPTTFKCSDCPKQATEYDHYLGYAPEHWLDVQPTCHSCNCKRAWRSRPFAKLHRQRISKAIRGIKRSLETKAKISKANKGRKHSMQSRINMGMSHLGSKRSIKTKAKMREARLLWWKRQAI